MKMENNGIILYYKGTSGMCEHFLLEDLAEWQLLDMQEKYYCVPIQLIRCKCGKLFEDAICFECPRCEKLRDDCD